MVLLAPGRRQVLQPRAGDSHVFVESLAPGTYSARLVSGSGPVTFAEVQVKSSLETVHEFVVGGREVELSIVMLGANGPIRPSLDLLRQEDGHRVRCYSLPTPRGVEPTHLRLRLGAGTWRVSGSAVGGWAGQASLVVDRLEGPPLSCEVLLRQM